MHTNVAIMRVSGKHRKYVASSSFGCESVDAHLAYVGPNRKLGERYGPGDKVVRQAKVGRVLRLFVRQQLTQLFRRHMRKRMSLRKN